MRRMVGYPGWRCRRSPGDIAPLLALKLSYLLLILLPNCVQHTANYIATVSSTLSSDQLSTQA